MQFLCHLLKTFLNRLSFLNLAQNYREIPEIPDFPTPGPNVSGLDFPVPMVPLLPPLPMFPERLLPVPLS